MGFQKIGFRKGTSKTLSEPAATSDTKRMTSNISFMKNGDINGLLVLHLGTRPQTSLFPKIRALSTDMIADLAKQCKKETINALVPEWITDYDRSKSILFCPRRTFHD